MNVDYVKRSSKGKNFSGMPHNFSIDQKGNLSVLMEKTTIIYSNNSVSTALGDIGITNFSLTGTENYGFMVPYANRLYGSHGRFFYYETQRGLKEAVMRLPMGSAKPYLYHIDLIPGKTNSYILFNSPSKNFENDQLDVSANFGLSISTSHAVYYKIDPSGNVTKNYMFGKTDNPAENKFCFFYTSEFDPNTGRYAVIKLEKINNKKQASVIWLTLE